MAFEVDLPGANALAGFRGQLLTILTRFMFASLLVMAAILYFADNALFLLNIVCLPLFLISGTDRYLKYKTRTWLVVSLFLFFGTAVAFSRMEPIGGRIFVICGACLACILMGLRPALFSLSVGLFALYIPFGLVVGEYYSLPVGQSTGPISDWHVQIFGGFIPGLILLFSFDFALNWLSRSENRAKLVTDHAADVIWNVDRDQKIDFVTPSVEKLLGLKVEELINQPASRVFSQADSSEPLGELLSHYLSGSGDYLPDESFEMEFTHTNGQTVWTENKIQLIIGHDGHPKGLSGVTRDITVRKQSEEEQNALEAQLRQAQKMESVGQLAGGVAHDFNNLLGVIQGYAELIQYPDVTEEEIQSCAREICKSSERAASLTHQLLLFSRKQEPDPKPLEINDLISNLNNMLERLLPETIQLDCRLTKNTGVVAGDLGQLEQVIVNLVVNARDAMEGQGEIVISTEKVSVERNYADANTWARTGDFTRITVSDTGKGIPKEMQAQIFEPFFTSKELGKGTGLGLSVVFGIVKQHNGFIDFESSSSGTQFYIYLPTIEEEAQELMQLEEIDEQGGNERILVIEDNFSLRELASHVLSKAGYDVLTAADGEQGLNVYKENAAQIDLIFSDVVMPKMSGGEVAKKIRSDNPDLPILFASGYTTDDTHLSQMIKEGTRILPKPYRAGALLSKVREVLDTPGSLS